MSFQCLTSQCHDQYLQDERDACVCPDSLAWQLFRIYGLRVCRWSEVCTRSSRLSHLEQLARNGLKWRKDFGVSAQCGARYLTG